MRGVVLVSLIGLSGPSSIADAQDKWAVADQAVVRVAPLRFSGLPAAIVADLDHRGCRIPQPAEIFGFTELSNVLRGDFTGPGRPEWAVLCSVRDTSQILVYPAAGASATDSLAKEADRVSLQTLGRGLPGYSRQLSAANPAVIRERARSIGERLPPGPLDHSGIEDAFLEKASVIHYKLHGTWRRFPGVDEQ